MGSERNPRGDADAIGRGMDDDITNASDDEFDEDDDADDEEDDASEDLE